VWNRTAKDILCHLWEDVCQTLPEKWCTGEWLLHHNNAPAQLALTMPEFSSIMARLLSCTHHTNPPPPPTSILWLLSSIGTQADTEGKDISWHQENSWTIADYTLRNANRGCSKFFKLLHKSVISRTKYWLETLWPCLIFSPQSECMYIFPHPSCSISETNEQGQTRNHVVWHTSIYHTALWHNPLDHNFHTHHLENLKYHTFRCNSKLL